FHNFETLVDEVTSAKEDRLFLLLDRVSDVRNFGAIIRTAECTGVDGIVILSSGSAPVTADTVKTSAGAVFNIPIAKVSHMKDAVYYLQASGVEVVAATEKTSNTLYDLDLKKPLAIVMGSEDKGISPAILKITDHLAKIPMVGDIASLNVSVACGVFLYEAVRQRMSS
ncbi:MAG: 23S rRNA (guanosine(2251)-2'-O)-methyltransferase RlmB, partial [Eudoraea sp.]|nr:23S rRNA (guanosine(2251)-2'-O)-methyltransferase RlmB [Eudoraea sp.]